MVISAPHIRCLVQISSERDCMLPFFKSQLYIFVKVVEGVQNKFHEAASMNIDTAISP